MHEVQQKENDNKSYKGYTRTKDHHNISRNHRESVSYVIIQYFLNISKL